MKRLITLLALPLIASACVPKEPNPQDYNKQSAPIDFGSYLNASVVNFDNDTLADAILDANKDAIFYYEGFEKQAHPTKRSLKMTPEMRIAGFKFIQAHNIIRYEAAKEEYKRDIKKYDPKDFEKAGKINPFQYPLENDSTLKSLLQMNQRRTLDISEKDSLWNSLTREQREKLVKDYYTNQHNRMEKK